MKAMKVNTANINVQFGRSANASIYSVIKCFFIDAVFNCVTDITELHGSSYVMNHLAIL